MSLYHRRKIEDRLFFLRKLLTQPGVDQKIDHYHRQQLTEEVQELEVKMSGEPRSEELEYDFA